MKGILTATYIWERIAMYGFFFFVLRLVFRVMPRSNTKLLNPDAIDVLFPIIISTFVFIEKMKFVNV